MMSPVSGSVSVRLTIAGSLIGGIKETQEMLDFCGASPCSSIAEHGATDLHMHVAAAVAIAFCWHSRAAQKAGLGMSS